MSTSIRQLVDRGVELRRQIKGLKKELDTIEDNLSIAALWEDHEPLADPERDGRRYLARGSQLVVPVIFTADKIVGTFKAGSPTHLNLLRIAETKFPNFFRSQHVFENRFDDGVKFRKEVRAELDGAAPEFVDACLARDKHGIPRSDIKIAWDDARDL